MEEDEKKNKVLKIYLKLECKRGGKSDQADEISSNVSQEFNFFNNAKKEDSFVTDRVT
jgi:hypothetical protein